MAKRFSGQSHQRQIVLDSDGQKVFFSQIQGNFVSAFKKIKVLFHGFKVTEVSLEGHGPLKVHQQDIPYLQKLTEFDPLPEHCHPYHECKDVAYVEMDYPTVACALTID